MDKDPENRLLAHQNRFRIDAENVRDVILRVSGLLSDKFGGPSVSPIEPVGYLAALNFPKREYSASHGEDLVPARRLHDLAADVPASEPVELRCADARGVHGQPQHVEHTAPGARFAQRSDLRRSRARVRAAGCVASAGTRSARRSTRQLAWVFDRALNRAPTAEERALLRGLYERSLKRFTADPASARALAQRRRDAAAAERQCRPPCGPEHGHEGGAEPARS